LFFNDQLMFSFFASTTLLPRAHCSYLKISQIIFTWTGGRFFSSLWRHLAKNEEPICITRFSWPLLPWSTCNHACYM